MACTNCSTGAKDGTPRGCKNNGTCGTDSCNKLTLSPLEDYKKNRRQKSCKCVMEGNFRKTVYPRTIGATMYNSTVFTV